jgi:hypothetical protein
MEFNEICEGKPNGHLTMNVFDRGVLVEVFDEFNLIVDGSKQTHARLLGGDVTNRSVAQFGVGTNGTAPAGGNSALTDSFVKAIDAVSYPATNQVKFDFSLGSSEANGKAIMEFGLLTAGGVLYSRRVRSAALNKDSDISISGSWTITF